MFYSIKKGSVNLAAKLLQGIFKIKTQRKNPSMTTENKNIKEISNSRKEIKIMEKTYQAINETLTMHGGRQGNLDGGTWHGGRQGDLDGGTWHGGRQGDLDGGTWHGG